MTQLDLLKATSKYIDAIVENERKELIDKACEWITQYILNHDQIDIFEMENDFRKAMEE